jgi:hypothetical protein
MLHRPIFLALSLGGALVAQNTTVSPVTFATRDGNSSLTYLFTTAPNNTQQVHGDLRGNVLVITALSFRRDGVSTATTGLSRTIDMEVAMGDADFARVGIDYAPNFSTPPLNVFTRKLVNTPNWQAVPGTPPAPFDFTLMLDTPFIYLGVTDLAWQMKCWSNTGTSTDGMRADLGTPAFVNSGTQSFGTACTATGATQSYQLLGTMGTNINPEFRWSVQGFPTPANCPINLLLVGYSDPALQIPGLCNDLHSSAEIQLVMPPSDTNGTWTLPLLYIPYDTLLVGSSFYEQAYSYDPGQPGIPMVGTVARRLTFMAAPASGDVVKIKSVRNTSAASMSATAGQSISEGGFVVQFTH